MYLIKIATDLVKDQLGSSGNPDKAAEALGGLGGAYGSGRETVLIEFS
ncbi:MAG: hypothetical protein O3A63_21290 [Proteobacteria bacterium]|nr:hypothetical protein [Pseudomonadota bacterium]